MKILAILATLVGCRNDAITYAHQLNPCARCTSINTAYTEGSHDTAACHTENEIWFCEVTNTGVAECKTVGKIEPPEHLACNQ